MTTSREHPGDLDTPQGSELGNLSAVRSARFQAALGYAARGWKVFPLHHVDLSGKCSCNKSNCDRLGKHPVAMFAKNGVNDATKDEAEIRKWFNWAPCNIGIATGPVNGILMLGPDGDQGQADLARLEEANGWLTNLPIPISASGSGGRHFLFNYPSDGKVPNRKNHLGTKIDVRGEGGYFVAPPSANGVGPYRWIVPPALCELPDAPLWLIEWCRTNETRPKSNPSATAGGAVAQSLPLDKRIALAVKYLSKTPAAVTGSGGHAAALWAARVLVKGCSLGRDVGRQVFVDYYNGRCSPAWSEAEIDHKIVEADESPFDKPEGWPIAEHLDRVRANPRRQANSPSPKASDSDSLPHATDVAWGRRLAADCGENIRYVVDAGYWAVYAGTKWDLAKSDVPIEGIAQPWAVGVAKAEASHLIHAKSSGDDELHAAAKKNFAEALALQDMRNLSRVIRAARSDPRVRIDRRSDVFDADPNLFNCANGTIDLRTGQIRPHNRTDYITRISDVRYDPAAECPTYNRLLRTVFKNDIDLTDYVLQFSGLAMTGSVASQTAHFFWGGGSNGKTTLIEAWRNVLGGYAVSLPAQAIMTDGKATRHLCELSRSKLWSHL